VVVDVVVVVVVEVKVDVVEKLDVTLTSGGTTVKVVVIVDMTVLVV